MRRLTHLDERGRLSMVDVGTKAVTSREAQAAAIVRISAKTLEAIAAQALPKGDVLAVAKVAGILAAKQTASLIPLTHPLMLTYVDVRLELNRKASAVEISSIVRCDGKTGVEIEAMTACAIAALTIYDMCKSIDRDIVIDQVRLMRKSGGKSGTYMRRS